METNKNWMAGTRAGLFNQSEQTMSVFIPGLDNYGYSEKNLECIQNEIMPSYHDYCTKYEAWMDEKSRTKTITEMLIKAEAEWKTNYRLLYRMIKPNLEISDEDLSQMQLPSRKRDKPTPVPVPSTIPIAKIELVSPGAIIVHFQDRDAIGKGKPAGVHGAEIKWALLEQAPNSYKELVNSAFDTRTPFELSFDKEDKGKRCFFSIRWENTRGEKGKWSDIYETVVP